MFGSMSEMLQVLDDTRFNPVGFIVRESHVDMPVVAEGDAVAQDEPDNIITAAEDRVGLSGARPWA